MDLIIRGKKIKDNVRCTEGSSPIVSLFPTTEFYNSVATAVTFLTPYEQGVRKVMAIHYFMQEKCLQPPLYPPCSMVQACPVRWTKQACAINTVSLYSLETATFLAKVFRILIQVLSDLAASSTKSFTKFCRYIQHPSLSEEKDKPVEPERLKLKIERYRSLE